MLVAPLVHTIVSRGQLLGRKASGDNGSLQNVLDKGRAKRPRSCRLDIHLAVNGGGQLLSCPEGGAQWQPSIVPNCSSYTHVVVTKILG